MTPIDTWFLVLSLFFPRLALFGPWMWGGMPAHVGVPWWLCFLGSVFLARILVTIFVAMNCGLNSGWFIAHLILAILGTFGEYAGQIKIVLDIYKIGVTILIMKLVDYIVLNEGKYNGIKLSKPQLNLLTKLDAMGVSVEGGLPMEVTNPTNGLSLMVHPFIGVLVNWVYKTYSTYSFSGDMNYKGTKVPVATFDRVRYLILALDAKTFSNFID